MSIVWMNLHPLHLHLLTVKKNILMVVAPAVAAHVSV